MKEDRAAAAREKARRVSSRTRPRPLDSQMLTMRANSNILTPQKRSSALAIAVMELNRIRGRSAPT
jgi:hypothetical protein